MAILAIILVQTFIYGDRILNVVSQECSVGLGKMMNCSKPDRFYYDETYVPILHEFSQKIPEKEAVVVFNEAPYLKFFLDRYAAMNWSLTSNRQLLEFMNKSDYKYMIILENNGATTALKNISSTKNLAKLQEAFDIVTNQSSRTRRIFLLRMKDG